MAGSGYGGYFLKGFASTFNPVAGINLGLQWKEKKKAQKKIDDAIEQLKLNSLELAAKYDRARADETITQEEYGDAMAWALPLGKEIMGKTKELYSNYQSMTSDQLQTELDNINAIFNYSKELDFTNLEQMKEFGNKLTQPNAKMQWDLIIKSIEKRKGIGQEVTPYGFYGESPADVKTRIAESVAGKMGLGIEFKEPIKTTEAPGITDYNSAVNYLSKFVNAPPETFNKIFAGFQKRFPNIDLSAITQESLREPTPAISKGVAVGDEAEVTPEKFRATPLTTLEKYRDSALASNTWADAEAIIDRYNKAGYDPSEMPVKQGWIDAKLGELDSHVEMLKEITDENGRLMGDKNFKFMSGDKVESQKGVDWYKDIYEAYIFYLEELRKMGIDVSKYPKIKSPGEVSKVGFLKGMFTTGGVERGYPSIYYTETAPTPTPTGTPKLPTLYP